MNYIKRLRMACRIAEPSPIPDRNDISFVRWTPQQLSDHANVLWESFQDDSERLTFPSLGTETGCRDLMHALISLPNFCPESMCLAIGPKGPVGTIQGVVQLNGEGEIQNLAVVPASRGNGVGTGLLARCLNGFCEAGVSRVHLEVSASNEPAIHLYRKFGFHSYKTVYLPAYGTLPERGSGI